MDVAHNTMGVESVMRAMKSQQEEAEELWVVCGFSKKKDQREILKVLLENSSDIFLISNSHFKITPACVVRTMAKEVKSAIRERGAAATGTIHELVKEGDIAETLKQVIEEARDKKKVRVVVLGSFFLMEEVRMALGFEEDAHDSLELNYKANEIKEGLKLI